MNKKLPRPADLNAGCCWLPRLTEKARRYLAGQLPLVNKVAFGSRFGVDGYFMRHFQLTFKEFMAAVKASGDDDSMERWFLRLPGVNQNSIREWNEFGPKLGLKGQPMYWPLRLFRWTYRAKLGPIDGMFSAIDQDES